MTVAEGSTPVGGVESFTQALDKLTFHGLPEIVAAFQIGWEVACLRDQCRQDLRENLDSAARMVIRIESAFADLTDLIIATDAVPAALAGQAYSSQLQASGGVAPYKWCIASGTAPDGLNLSATGLISGRAATADDYVFTVQVIDGSAPPNVTQREFTLQVAPGGPAVPANASGTQTAPAAVDLFASARYPTTTDMRKELNVIANPGAENDNKAFKNALDKFDRDLRRAFAFVAATAPLPQAGDGKLLTSTAVTSALGDAYELGNRLMHLVLLDWKMSDEHKLPYLLNAPGQVDINAPDTYRIRALLGSLRDSFPSSAANAVARNIEDWAAWVNGERISTAAPDFSGQPLGTCQTAMKEQGKVWESILTGQSRGRDYLGVASYPDAADHLIVAWSGILDSIVRTLRKTIVGRTLLILFAVGILLAALAIAVSFLKTQNPSGAETTVVTVGGLIAAIAGAAGIHVNRTQINSVVAKAWQMAESVLVEAEIVEAIAVATRRLPGEGLGGGAGFGQRASLKKYRLRKPRQVPPPG